MSTAFPRPFLFTVGINKGGAAKTWVSLNLAGYLGRKGYRVLLLDMNPTNDATKDVAVMESRGEKVPFTTVHDPEAGLPGHSYDKLASGYDFVIADTFQYLEFLGTKWAWETCHAMILPVSPDQSDSARFEASLLYFTRLRTTFCPLLAVPVKTDVLLNGKAMKDFAKLLDRFRQVGAEAPEFSQKFFVDYNSSMKQLDVRSVYSKTEGRSVTETFLAKVELNLAWILSTVQKHYGPLPPV